MFKRARVLVCAALAAASLFAATTATAQSPTLNRVVKTGELRVGMSADQPPLNFESKSGEMMGLEVDLVRGLAHALGLELKIVKKPFGELFKALKTKKVDMVMSGLDITPKRSKDFLFVGPYLLSGKSLVTKSQRVEKMDSLLEANEPSYTFVALKNSTSQEFVKKYLPKAKSVAVNNYKQGVAMLLDGKADAMIADMPACMLTVLRNPDSGLVTLAEPLMVDPVGIAVPKNDRQFYNLIKNYLDGIIMATDAIETLQKKWYQNGDWLTELP